MTNFTLTRLNKVKGFPDTKQIETGCISVAEDLAVAMLKEKSNNGDKIKVVNDVNRLFTVVERCDDVPHFIHNGFVFN